MIDIGYLFATASIIGYIVARTLSNVFKFDKNNYEKNTCSRSGGLNRHVLLNQ